MRPAIARAAACLAVAGGAALLSGCLSAVDPEAARICRTALPALEAPGIAIQIGRIARAEESDVAIRYHAIRPDGRRTLRNALCRFGPAIGPRRDLVGLSVDGRSLSGASLYLLRRYYIDSPEGTEAAPSPLDTEAALPEWPEPLLVAADQVQAAAPRMAIYGLLAAAFALVHGLVGRVHLAFGPIVSLGAAATGLVAVPLAAASLVAGPLAGVPIVIGAVAAAIGAAALHNAVLGRAAFAAVDPRRSQASLIATVGLGLALSEYLRLAGSAKPLWIPPIGGEPAAVARAGSLAFVLAPLPWLVALAAGLALAALVATMRGTRFGRDWRACAQDRLAAQLCGIDPDKLLTTTLMLAGALGGFAGALLALQFGALGFADGFPLGLKALAAAILGGVGSVEGAILGGLAIGLFETLWSAVLPIEGRDMAVFIALIGIVILMPEGFAGRRAP